MQKKIKERMNKDKLAFNDWYAENHELLDKFDVDKGSEINENGVAAKRKIWLSVAVFLLVAAVCLVIVLPLTLGRNNDFDISLGVDEDSYESIMSDAKLNDILTEYDFLNKLQIDEQLEVRLLEEDKIVMYIIGGNISAQQDYHVVVRISVDDGYDFAEKEIYQSLLNETNAGDWFVAYGSQTAQEDGSCIYLFRLERDEETLYMQVQCPEDGISYILNEFVI